jgi:hypothetical protein
VRIVDNVLIPMLRPRTKRRRHGQPARTSGLGQLNAAINTAASLNGLDYAMLLPSGLTRPLAERPVAIAA